MYLIKDSIFYTITHKNMAPHTFMPLFHIISQNEMSFITILYDNSTQKVKVKKK